MINKLKNNFKTYNNCSKFLKFNNSGPKIYINTTSDTNLKKKNKFNKYDFGYCYNINLFNFNSIYTKLTIIDKKTKEYVKFIKYINLFNNNLLFTKKNKNTVKKNGKQII